MKHSKKGLVLCLLLILLISTNSVFAADYDSESNISKGDAVNVVYNFDNRLNDVIWTGTNYVAVHGTNSIAYTSINGLTWDKQNIKIFHPNQLVLFNNKITVTGGFYKSELGVATSENGTEWTPISTSKDRFESGWCPPTKLIHFKDKLFLFIGSRVYISTDGTSFTEKRISTKDPNKLTSKGYSYLGEEKGDVYAETIVSDGTYLYGVSGDYFGNSVLRSSDGLTWEFVYFTSDKYALENAQIIIGNGRYIVTGNDSKMLVSEDGINWSVEVFTRSDLVESYENSSYPYNIIRELPDIYYYKGNYFLTTNRKPNTIFISQDLKSFKEYNVGEDVGYILFVDDQYIITDKKVLDFSNIEGLILADRVTTAKPTTSSVIVNGKKVNVDAYNIGGYNYFKLRDVAMLLNDSTKQFAVDWNYVKNAIELTSKIAYTPVGSELSVTQNPKPQKATLTTAKTYLDGEEAGIIAYNINGYNYYKLRDLGQYIDFFVDWDGSNNAIIIDTSKGYE